jgi:hypothetical protein
MLCYVVVVQCEGVKLKKILRLGDPLRLGGGLSLARVRIFGKKIMGPVTIYYTNLFNILLSI